MNRPIFTRADAGAPPPSAGEPPPPPPPPGPTAAGAPAGQPAQEKAGVGWRILAPIVALALAFGGAVLILFALNPDNTPRCDQHIPSSSCLQLTHTQQLAATITAWPGGVLAAIGVLLALYFAVTGRAGRLFAGVTIAAVLFGAATIFITKVL